MRTYPYRANTMIELLRVEVDNSLGGSVFGCSMCCFNQAGTIFCNRPDNMECSEQNKEYYFKEVENATNKKRNKPATTR
jgi:hypothetical protein